MDFKTPQKMKISYGLLWEFYLSGSYKDCCNMKVICLIEISSCLVKHTEVTQKYTRVTELKKSKRLYATRQNLFLHFLFLAQTALPLWLSLNILRKCRIILFGILRHTRTHNIYKETFTDTLIEKIPSRNVFLKPFSCQLIRCKTVKQPA